MTTLLLSIFLFCNILYYLIIFDVIASWLALFGLQLRIGFIDAILGPMYRWIKSVVPTTVGPLELTPIIALMIVIFVQSIIITLDPAVPVMMQNFFR